MDPGAPINPGIGKKFLITTFITTIIFDITGKFDLLNLRSFYNNVSFKIFHSYN